MKTNAYLTLAQWFSPAFPVGAFAYSHGLEHVIDKGGIDDAATLQNWIADVLRYGSGRSDAVLLVTAYAADALDVAAIDRTARAFASSAERLTETVDQGTAFARTIDAIWATEIGPLCYPVAVGRAAQAEGLPLDLTVEFYLHAMIANLISAAVRLVPLGQTEGQAVLAGLAPVVHGVARDCRDASLDDLSSACFALDIAAMHHETQYSKVFRT